jgi:riboflavin synthase
VKELRKTGRRIVRLTLEVPAVIARNLKHGGSVAVSGVCLSAVSRRGRRLSFDVVSETLRRTTLGGLKPGDRVNLERPLRYGSRIEGHCVLGHIDGTAVIDRVRASGRQKDFLVRYPKPLRRFIVEKGSVALDGVSLTIGKSERGAFWVHCIPVTLRKTTFGARRPGDRLNLEADWLVKSLRAKGSRRLDGSLRIV